MLPIHHLTRGWLLALSLAASVSFASTPHLCRRTASRQSAPVPSAFRDPPPPPKVVFTDVTVSAGIASAPPEDSGKFLLPESIGPGAAFFDFDADGDQDLIVINSAAFRPAGPSRALTLYENDSTGHFRDVTTARGLEISFFGMGAAVGDYDNDGYPDVFFTALGENHLFHNEGGRRFVDVTVAAGVAGSPQQWTTSAAWIDYDNNSLLDLFVCHYVRWSPDMEKQVRRQSAVATNSYLSAAYFDGDHSVLYRNEGDGRFHDVSNAAGLRITKHSRPDGKALGVAPVDIDGDGWIDLIVGNDGAPTMLFHNQKNGAFREMGSRAGVAFDAFGNVCLVRGVDVAWIHNDRTLAIATGTGLGHAASLFLGPPRALYFEDVAANEGLEESRNSSKYGVLFFDYDLDGWPDLLAAGGDEKARRPGSPDSGTRLFWNGGTGREYYFTAVSPDQSGTDLFQPRPARGAAYADIDGDGDLDILITRNGGSPVLLRNDQESGNRSLRVRLLGTRSNRNAIGTHVCLRSAKRRWHNQVMPAHGYLSQSELPITFGLGTDNTPTELEIQWPVGRVQKVRLRPGERNVTIVETPKARVADNRRE